jgi:hypothetical protein
MIIVTLELRDVLLVRSSIKRMEYLMVLALGHTNSHITGLYQAPK